MASPKDANTPGSGQNGGNPPHGHSAYARFRPLDTPILGNRARNNPYAFTPAWRGSSQEDPEEDEEHNESFIEQDRWIKPGEIQAKIKEVRDLMAAENDPKNAVNPSCGCGHWFFPRAICRHSYPWQEFYCPRAQRNGGTEFCPRDPSLPMPCMEGYEAPDDCQWFVITDEPCNECEEKKEQLRQRTR
ncbi:hypothetical protein B0T21DRAFT_344984 [Apiosordaria backusii]|uniref:Uncharacterized protein n=1 Tax=Apiosordaria backusii TaxID=314023 RepID=A0AA40ESV0_9PEZI|nr:hypothetical protein B0T21DRAFT_344984 [Apiosordaria backusii]